MLERLLKSEKLQELRASLQQGESHLVEELWDAPKAAVIALAQLATGKNILILTGKSQEELALFHDLKQFTERPVVEFPAWETLPGENIAPSPDVVGERYRVLSDLMACQGPLIIVSSLAAALQKLIPKRHFESLYMQLEVGREISFEGVAEKLVRMGYEREAVAADKGVFAVRGGIIDIFPVSSPDPFRVEFWGDEITSIRTYDPVGQKSIEQKERFEITPAKELELLSSQQELHSILDYLGDNTLVVLDDLLALEDRYAQLVSLQGKRAHTFMGIEELLDQAAPLQKLFWPQETIEELSEIKQLERSKGSYYSLEAPMKKIAFHAFQREFAAWRWIHPFTPISSYLLPEKEEELVKTEEEILGSLSKLSGSEYSLVLLCQTEAEKSSLQKKALHLMLKLPDHTAYVIGYLSSGFALHEEKLVVFPTTEITHRFKIRRQKLRSTYHTVPSETMDLHAGELVVHMNNGIGKYLGIEKKAGYNGIESEFFLIEYAENAKLYVPIQQAHLVTKYIGVKDELPKLHTLGSGKWKKIRESSEKAILGYAADLLQMYAKRQMQQGISFPEDSSDLLAFEEEFPFVETEDQLLAISSIKKDMRSSRSMDRLVCGDVGYGKTEVAMRAAFKAVVDGGRQVAMLVPTTVLAMQHYENFVERMRNFPINIAVLSRFRTAKQNKESLEGLKKGSVDIVIGTHRLISRDVEFHNLGLVIIDEEQRFGVRAKEHLKKIKTNVDCLTLSATPIPRTLYMSLIEARDLSVINTPPQDRLPIKTIIAEPSDSLIKTALLRELTRDGQAYVIHNRVESIYGMQERINNLLPQAKTAVVHGQMHPNEIDHVFHAFKNGLIDILIATSIVENGIDIPNANTILIDRADRFGLADLYQLRGRVGRWNRKAYAYFLIPRFLALPELSRKRLQALAEASGYGGGMKLAMRDLEHRGAGNILGTEQSGHVAAIGFHLYCKLLKRTIKTLEGSIPHILIETKVDIPVDARLPEGYINESKLRLEMYQRIGEAVDKSELEGLFEEMTDRFGPYPDPVKWLYAVSCIRMAAAKEGYTLVKVEGISLISEQKVGKGTVSKRQLLGKISTPQALEEKVLSLLQKQ